MKYTKKWRKVQPRSYRKAILLAQTSKKSLSERVLIIKKMKCLSKRTLILIQAFLSTLRFYHFPLLGTVGASALVIWMRKIYSAY